MAVVQESRGDRAIGAVITVLVVCFAVLSLYPIINAIALSFSSGAMANRGLVRLLPREFTTSAWEQVLGNSNLWRSLGVSTWVASFGTFLSLAMTALFAYPLSRPKFVLSRLIMFMIVFTMIFRYPLIPYFLTVRSYGLIDSLWSLIATHLIIAYNLVIMRTFFRQLPEELNESAFMEGAGHFQVLLRITLPLSKPVLATLGLFYAVTYWNLFLHPLMFIRDGRLFPLQIRLRQMLTAADTELIRMESVQDFSLMTIRGATIIFATVPILLVYPFLQKYFVKGAMLGSLKG
jgi:putative aldouronate transport system permease protein